MKLKIFMRKIQTMVLAVLLMVATTGFANVKVYDTGPPATENTCFVVNAVELAPVFDAPFINESLAYEIDQVYLGKKEEAIIQNAVNVATKKTSTAFIDRHRRWCNKLSDYNKKRGPITITKKPPKLE